MQKYNISEKKIGVKKEKENLPPQYYLDNSTDITMQNIDEESTDRAASMDMNRTILHTEMEQSFFQLKDHYNKISKTCSSQEEQIVSLHLLVSDLQSKLSTQEKKIITVKQECDRKERSSLKFEEREKDTRERMYRMEVESDALREEISNLTSQNKELNTKLVELRTSSSLSSSCTTPLQYEVTRLRNELESLQTHSSWLEGEVTTRSNIISELKSSHANILQDSNTDRDNLKSIYNDLDIKHSVLNLHYSTSQKKIEALHSELLEKEKNHANNIRELKNEVNSKERLADLYKDSSRNIEDRYNDAVREIEAMKRLASVAVEEQNKEFNDMKTKLGEEMHKILEQVEKDNESKILDLKDNFNRVLEEKLRLEEKFMLSRPNVPCLAKSNDNEKKKHLSRENEPESIVGLYEKLSEAQEDLKYEKIERHRVEMYLERIQQEFEIKTPALVQQRKEYEFAISQKNELELRLKTALEEFHMIKVEMSHKEIDIKETDYECQRLRVENIDLAQQIQVLLQKSIEEPLASTSEDLVSFGSVEELQSQNQRLLREYHRLTMTVSELEKKLDEDELQIQLREAENDIVHFKEERKNQETLVAGIVQQRDLYRTLLISNRPQLNVNTDGIIDNSIIPSEVDAENSFDTERKNAELMEIISKLTIDLSSALNDKKGLEERLIRLDGKSAELSLSVEKLHNDLALARESLTRSNAENNFYKQKTERLDKTIESFWSDKRMVNESKQELQRVNEDLQTALLTAKSVASKYKDNIIQQEKKLRLTETQVETLRKTEIRLTVEAESLRSELAKQGSLIDSIQRIEASLLSRTNDEYQRLNDENIRLCDTISSERNNYLIGTERLQNKVFSLEKHKDFIDKKKEGILNEMLNAREETIQAKRHLEVLTQKCSELQKSLNSGNISIAETESLVLEQENPEKHVSELETSKENINIANTIAKDYRSLSKDTEKALKDMTHSTYNFKHRTEADVERLTFELRKAERTIQIKNEYLEELVQMLTNHFREKEEKVNKLKENIESLSIDIKFKQNEEICLKERIETLSTELYCYKADAEAGRNNYEREISLHASTSEALREAQNEVIRVNDLRHNIESNYKILKSETLEERTSWMDEKRNIKISAEEAASESEALRVQNRILHDQVVSLISTIQKDKKSYPAICIEQPSSEIKAVEKQISDMREVVRFMKSERDLFDSQLMSARRTSERERALAEINKQSFLKTRDELNKLLGTDTEIISRIDDKLPSSISPHQLLHKLKETENQLLFLQDSNKLLREDCEKSAERLLLSQNEIKEHLEKLDALESKCQKLEVENSVLSMEKSCKSREVEGWKDRVHNIVSNFDQVDPKEHKKVLAQIDSSRKECISLEFTKEQIEKECTSAKVLVAKLNTEISKQKLQIDNLRNALEKATSEKETIFQSSALAANIIVKERDNLKASKEALEADLKVSKIEVEGSKKRLDNLTKMLRTNKSRYSELQQKYTQALTKEQDAKKILLKEHETKRVLMREQDKKQECIIREKRSSLSSDTELLSDKQSISIKFTDADNDTGVNNTPDSPVILKFITNKECFSKMAVDLKHCETQMPKVPKNGFQFAPSLSKSANDDGSFSTPDNKSYDLTKLFDVKSAVENISREEGFGCNKVEVKEITSSILLKHTSFLLKPSCAKDSNEDNMTESLLIVSKNEKTHSISSYKENHEGYQTKMCTNNIIPGKPDILLPMKDLIVDVATVSTNKHSTESALRQKLMKRKRELEAEIKERSTFPILDKYIDAPSNSVYEDVTESGDIFLESSTSRNKTEDIVKLSPIHDTFTQEVTVNKMSSSQLQSSIVVNERSNDSMTFVSKDMTFQYSDISGDSYRLASFQKSLRTLPEVTSLKLNSESVSPSCFKEGEAFLNLQPSGKNNSTPQFFGSSNNIRLPTFSKTSLVTSASKTFSTLNNQRDNLENNLRPSPLLSLLKESKRPFFLEDTNVEPTICTSSKEESEGI